MSDLIKGTTNCGHNKWDYVLSSGFDHTGALVICQVCDNMEFIDIVDKEEFEKQNPGIKARDIKKYSEKENTIKDYVIVKDNHIGGFDIWTRDRFCRYGLISNRFTIVTHFNEDETLSIK